MVTPEPCPAGERGARTALLVLDAFTAVTAVAGGVLLGAGREDQRFGFEALARAPFSDYTVPGWLLGVVVGGSAAVATAATLRGTRLGAGVSAGAGMILLGWTVGEELVLDLPEKTTTDLVTTGVYLSVGATMVTLGLALRRLTGRHPGRPARPTRFRGGPHDDAS